jgi:hypothetical protein
MIYDQVTISLRPRVVFISQARLFIAFEATLSLKVFLVFFPNSKTLKGKAAMPARSGIFLNATRGLLARPTFVIITRVAARITTLFIIGGTIMIAH